MARSGWLAVAALAVVVGACGSGHGPPEAQPTLPPPTTSTTTTTTTTTSPVAPRTTARPVTTTRLPPTTTRFTTTTRPLLSPQAASTALCRDVSSALSSIDSGRLVAAALRLGGAINNYPNADGALVSATRSMLRSGVRGDLDGFVGARRQAESACSRYGVVLPSGVVETSQAR